MSSLLMYTTHAMQCSGDYNIYCKDTGHSLLLSPWKVVIGLFLRTPHVSPGHTCVRQYSPWKVGTGLCFRTLQTCCGTYIQSSHVSPGLCLSTPHVSPASCLRGLQIQSNPNFPRTICTVCRASTPTGGCWLLIGQRHKDSASRQ